MDCLTNRVLPARRGNKAAEWVIRCTACKRLRPASEFNKNRHRKNGLQTTCRECSRKKSRDYYRANPEKHKRAVFQRNKRVLGELKARLSARKAEHGCALCPEREPVCLEFHHLNPEEKDFEIGKYLREHQSWGAVLREIRKCVVLCC